MATLTSSSSSPRCVPFGFRRGGGGRRTRGLPAPGGSHATGAVGCGRPLCRAAELVGGGIRGAFFTSLETCSCVEVRTKHDDDSFRMPDAADPDPEAAAPLINGGRRRRKGSKQRRGGLAGCCDANSTSTVN
ncbi:unnamed protein product [Urochloa decumbens]|uniref:Uncharacterized protein n=1 Tax=Urochloa decumbens TaxID=240449 RepID=A0ABC8VHE0_9POAL